MDSFSQSINNSLALTTLAAAGSLVAVVFAIFQWLDVRRNARNAKLEAGQAEAYEKLQGVLSEISTRSDVPLDVRVKVVAANNEVRATLSGIGRSSAMFTGGGLPTTTIDTNKK